MTAERLVSESVDGEGEESCLVLMLVDSEVFLLLSPDESLKPKMLNSLGLVYEDENDDMSVRVR